MASSSPHASLSRRARALTALALLSLAACGTAPRDAAPAPLPAAAGGHAQAPDAGMVSSAHPLATEAGLEVLRRGGSAIDAAVAVQAMLGLVEPQSSGLLGGAIVLHYDAASGRVDSWIGRERAPAGAGPGMFSDADGRPLSRAEAMLSGRATGVPGALPALELAHAAHGTLEWSSLFESTARRAELGFAVTPRLHRHIAGRFPQASAPDVVALFAGPDGTPLRIGDTFRNPAYAASLRTIAARGADALRSGPLADQLAARVAAPPHAARMTPADLQAEVAERSDPICRPLRAHVLCVAPPPASGVGLLQLMLLLDGTDIAARGPDDPQAWHLFAEASRLMYADRDHYVGDPRFADVPVQGLLDPDYLAARRALIGPRAAAGAPAHGRPPGAPARDVDVAGARARPRRRLRRRDRIAGRQRDPGLHRQDPGRLAVLGPAAAAGDRPAQPGRTRRPLQRRGRCVCIRCARCAGASRRAHRAGCGRRFGSARRVPAQRRTGRCGRSATRGRGSQPMSSAGATLS